MMSAETRAEIADDMAQEARVNGRVPSHDPPIPALGDYRPAGFQMVRVLFCDTSGFGETGEAALTIDEFMAARRADEFYGVIEVGQFQAYIGCFVKVGRGEPREVDEVEYPSAWDIRRGVDGGGA